MFNNKLIAFFLQAGIRFSYALIKKKKLVTILCLHRIGPGNDPFYPPIPTEVFDELCKYLRKNYNVLSVSDLFTSRASSKKPLLAITFDDGYKDFMEYALPVLLKYDLKANMNVITNSLDNNVSYNWQAFVDLFKEKVKLEDDYKEKFVLNFTKFYHSSDKSIINKLEERYLKEHHYKSTPMMSWEDVKKLHHLGFEIGSQTHNHFSLNTLGREEIEFELQHSKKRIEEELNAPVNIIAFPAGKINEMVLELSRQAGYKYFLLNDNYLNKKPVKAYDRILLYGDNILQLKAQMTGLRRPLKNLFQN